jgi:hypothetical protein
MIGCSQPKTEAVVGERRRSLLDQRVLTVTGIQANEVCLADGDETLVRSKLWVLLWTRRA